MDFWIFGIVMPGRRLSSCLRRTFTVTSARPNKNQMPDARLPKVTRYYYYGRFHGIHTVGVKQQQTQVLETTSLFFRRHPQQQQQQQ
jgi:hypothetical protein